MNRFCPGDFGQQNCCELHQFNQVHLIHLILLLAWIIAGVLPGMKPGEGAVFPFGSLL